LEILIVTKSENCCKSDFRAKHQTTSQTHYGHHAPQEAEVLPSPPSPERVPSAGGIVWRALAVGCVLGLALLAGSALLVALLLSFIVKQC